MTLTFFCLAQPDLVRHPRGFRPGMQGPYPFAHGLVGGRGAFAGPQVV